MARTEARETRARIGHLLKIETSSLYLNLLLPARPGSLGQLPAQPRQGVLQQTCSAGGCPVPSPPRAWREEGLLEEDSGLPEPDGPQDELPRGPNVEKPSAEA